MELPGRKRMMLFSGSANPPLADEVAGAPPALLVLDPDQAGDVVDMVEEALERRRPPRDERPDQRQADHRLAHAKVAGDLHRVVHEDVRAERQADKAEAQEEEDLPPWHRGVRALDIDLFQDGFQLLFRRKCCRLNSPGVINA